MARVSGLRMYAVAAMAALCVCVAALLPTVALAQAAPVASGAVPIATVASNEVPPTAPANTAVQCTDASCSNSEGVLMRVRTRGDTQPATTGTTAASSAQALQPDRRVTVESAPPGKAIAIGKWSVQLPNGGMLWATEDPNLGQPSFDVSAPSMVPYANGRITGPVQFMAYSNYPAFVQRVEVLVFRASDNDLVTPLATIALPVAAVAQASWDGALPDGFGARAGDELVYIARLHGADGSIDETSPRRFQLARPEDALRGAERVRDSLEKGVGAVFSVDDAASRSLLNDVFGQSSLRLQNIPIYGSRIRIQGRNLPAQGQVTINAQSQPVDLEGKLAAEYLVPVGEHAFDIAVKAPGQAPLSRTLQIDVTGRYLFAVAIADLTASQGGVSGSIEPLANDDGYDKDFLVDGRLAFYLKGKIQGKYLITAQADTQERELGQLFTGFWDADPQDIFRRLDPNEYYPVYGDDSTTYRDVDTQGRLYVRVDWDQNQALWGNFDTGISGTQYGQYTRALYGAALNWRSRNATAIGAPASQLRVFAAKAQTAPGHSEFLGTGGSLYYLKHTDLLPGSDRVALEIRDGTTGRVQARVELQRGADYEINEMQGRILLTRPLAQVTRENVPTLTRDAPLDGFAQLLLADYEYVPAGAGLDDLAGGVRARHWFGEHLALGATYVDENRDGEDYTLKGADVTLQAGRGTYLSVEHTQTDATSAPVFYSGNGGLSFEQLNNDLGLRKGSATAVEARANFQELGWTKLEWSAAGWWRKVDQGFSVSRYDTGQATEERGVEVLGQVTKDFDLYARYSIAERGAQSLTQAQLTAQWRLDDNRTLAGELRRVDEQRLAGDGVGTLGALQYTQRFDASLDLYGIAQFTLDDDGGRYRDNNAITLGAKYLFGNQSTIGAEASAGDRGNAAQLNGEYRLSPEHSIYGGYVFSTDRTAYDPLFNDTGSPGWTLGQRWRLSNQVNVFNETQFLKAPNESGLAHTFGLDFYPAQGWNIGFTLQAATLDHDSVDPLLGQVERRAVSVNGGRTNNIMQWQSKVEWRRDTGAEEREQWVTTNRLLYRVNESLRLAGLFNYSDTDDRTDPLAGARFIEGNAGFAWRPWNTTRYALLGKYTYLYDVSALPQVGDNVAFYDQRSNILSLEGVYMPDGKLEFAAKLMQRSGDVRMGRMTGQWADSSASFAAGQVRYKLVDVWHALAEYRWLSVVDGGNQQGLLVGLDRDIGPNFRLGVGYNFTNFSDDLSNFDDDHKGFFLNVVGSY